MAGRISKFGLPGLFLILLISFVSNGCNQGNNQSEGTDAAVQTKATKQLNLLTFRYLEKDKQLFEQFRTRTGVNINATLLNPGDDLVEALEKTAYDLVILDDMEQLHQAKAKNLLQPFSSAAIDQNVPFKLKDRDGYWVSLSKTGIALAYAKDRVKPAQVASLESLTGGEMKGKVLMSSLENSVNRALIGEMYAKEGERSTTNWLKKVSDNLASTAFW